MILVLNCGSQTIKYEVYDKETLEKKEGKNYSGFIDYNEKIREIIEEVSSKFEISAVGHRVVHGGAELFDPVLIDDEVIEKIERASKFAPLHNPYNLTGIREAKSKIEKPNIAIFDTGFYKDLPSVASEYAIPKEIRSAHNLKRLGFHGISHKYAIETADKKLKREKNEDTNTKNKIVSCHLGGGASITAYDGEKAIDTSMGFTPLEGLVMMTRSGDIDPGILIYLVREFGVEKTERILNNESGMLGLCGETDMLKIIENVKKAEENFVKAFNIYIYRLKKYIGAYYSILGGCDALVFTGGVGAGDSYTRKMVFEDMPILDDVRIFVIPSNEGLMIAREVKAILRHTQDK